MAENNTTEISSIHFFDWVKRIPNIVKLTTGLIVGTASLLGAISTIYLLIVPKPKEVILTSFEVFADNESGYIYTYPKNKKTAILYYSVTPEDKDWLAIPLDIKEHGISTGSVNADGYFASDFTPNSSRPCKNYRLGALVVINNKDGECLANGRKNFFQAQPGEAYRFVMNDVKGLYRDNKGSLPIQLIENKKSAAKEE
jgi:hypothetical protein